MTERERDLRGPCTVRFDISGGCDQSWGGGRFIYSEDCDQGWEWCIVRFNASWVMVTLDPPPPPPPSEKTDTTLLAGGNNDMLSVSYVASLNFEVDVSLDMCINQKGMSILIDEYLVVFDILWKIPVTCHEN